jgi:alpha-tubulin suppressor-like RCC1 family protein
VLSGPVQVSLPGAALQLASGFSHSCAVLDSGELWCWGDGNEGQLGRDDFYGGGDSRDEDALVPELISVQDEATGWSFVDTGEGHTCGLRGDGALWCWGRNTGRQVGVASDEGQIRAPVRVGADTDWQSLDAAQNYTCALKTDGTLWCWGFNMGFASRSGNPLGMPGTLQLDAPTQVADGQWRALSTNMFHTCAIDLEAQVWCWGRNHEGQLTLENPPDPEDPTRRLEVHPRTLVASGAALVGVGTFTTCVVPASGGLRCVGKNDRGQLGVPGLPATAEFVDVPLPEALPAESP